MRPGMRRWLFLSLLILAPAACTAPPVLTGEVPIVAPVPAGVVQELPSPTATARPCTATPPPAPSAGAAPALSTPDSPLEQIESCELCTAQTAAALPPLPPLPVPDELPTTSAGSAAPPGAKRIMIDIAAQRLRAYEGDLLKWDWLCSTGIESMPTRSGEFEILDKIPDAWSAPWGLSMPYWMGIYWTGASENGIHALPILQDGQTLWAGYLGTPVSFGCIILDTPNAAALYEWADIGTPVIIRE